MQIKEKIKAAYHEWESPYVIGNNLISDQIEQKPVLICGKQHAPRTCK